MRIEWTADALADFEHISTWIENERTLALAKRICRRVCDAVQTPGRQPSTGRTGRAAGTRELVVTGTPWIAVYRVKSDVIHVLRILHVLRTGPRPSDWSVSRFIDRTPATVRFRISPYNSARVRQLPDSPSRVKSSALSRSKQGYLSQPHDASHRDMAAEVMHPVRFTCGRRCQPARFSRRRCGRRLAVHRWERASCRWWRLLAGVCRQ